MKLIKRLGRKTERIWTRAALKIRWLSRYFFRTQGVTDTRYPEKIIVSLTSFPARISTVNETIKTLLMQSLKPNQIILWLAEEEFPFRESGLPRKLVKMKKYGLEINWYHNIRSFKKLIPTLQLYPEAVIITADDDLLYRKNWLRILYTEHLKHPDMVCAYRITKFYLENNSYKIVGGGYDTWPEATYLHKLTGCAGVLYPPDIFHEDILDNNMFLKICPTNDDIWFWLMAVLNGAKIYVPVKGKKNLNLIYVHGTQEGPSLFRVNDKGEMLFWKAFSDMLQQYPVLDKILREEYDRMVQKYSGLAR